MKFVAFILVSLSLFTLAYSAKETTQIPILTHIKNAVSNRLSSILNRKPSVVKPVKPIPVKHDCNALKGCDKGVCHIDKSKTNRKHLICHCKKCKPGYNQVCPVKGQCHCRRYCPVINKPKHFIKSQQVSNFVKICGNNKYTKKRGVCKNHMKNACWQEYDKICKQEVCIKFDNYNKCLANLKTSVNWRNGRHTYVRRTHKPRHS